MGVHGTASQISFWNEYLGSVPIEEVPLRTKASPACLEREDHATIASDGLRNVKIGILPVHPERLTQIGYYLTVC